MWACFQQKSKAYVGWDLRTTEPKRDSSQWFNNVQQTTQKTKKQKRWETLSEILQYSIDQSEYKKNNKNCPTNAQKLMDHTGFQEIGVELVEDRRFEGSSKQLSARSEMFVYRPTVFFLAVRTQNHVLFFFKKRCFSHAEAWAFSDVF